jgi:actin-related protein
MSNHYLSDYQPPIIIDVGTDRVKFAQSLLNPQSISKQLREAEKKNGTSENFSFPLNPNTIFELDIFVDSIPTIIASSLNNNKENSYYMTKYSEQMKISDPTERKIKNYELFCEKLKNEFNNDPNLNIDLSLLYKSSSSGNNLNHQQITSEFGKFENIDMFWGGQIRQSELENWKEVISTVGKMKLQNHNFLNKCLSETPIILTQKALPYDILKDQNMKIFEILFEEYKCPYAMISSLGVLNAYSQNIESGIIIDMGESGTNITVVKDGFTMYNDSIFLPFLSGRNINCLLASYINEVCFS